MLEVRNLEKSFGPKQVLFGVDFQAQPGRILGLVGKNGAGKTTIINCILKMIKPDSGNIFYMGKNIFHIKNKNYFKDISVLLESSSNVYDCLTGMQNIKYFCGLSNLNFKKNEKIDFYIEEFGLAHDINEKVGAYSRGMQQKLALIIALMTEPKLLLLDEPTLGLDIASKYIIVNILKNMAAAQKISILLTTHQMDVVQKIGGRVLLLKNGTVESFDTINAIAQQTDTYKIVYIDTQGNTIETEENLTFNEIYNKYNQYNIQEIKKIDRDIEKIMIEKLHESV